MAIFNLKKREIECKLVYYGPGRCGKTTNLEYIFKTFKKQVSGEMVSINTEGDRTLFFDFLPIGLGQIKGCDVKVEAVKSEETGTISEESFEITFKVDAPEDRVQRLHELTLKTCPVGILFEKAGVKINYYLKSVKE